MNAYTDMQMIVVKQIQAERRAQAERDRTVADGHDGQTAPRTTERRGWLHRVNATGGTRTPVAER